MNPHDFHAFVTEYHRCVCLQFVNLFFKRNFISSFQIINNFLGSTASTTKLGERQFTSCFRVNRAESTANGYEWLFGATVARLTPDQTVGGSSPSRVMFLFFFFFVSSETPSCKFSSSSSSDRGFTVLVFFWCLEKSNAPMSEDSDHEAEFQRIFAEYKEPPAEELKYHHN